MLYRVHVDWKVSGSLWHRYLVTVVKPGGSAVTRSSFCLYSAWASGSGWVVFCTIRFSQCLKHLHTKNTDMHFANGFLNGNCRDAIVKYPQRHSTSQKCRFAKHVRLYTNSNENCFLPAKEFRMWTVAERIRRCYGSNAAKHKYVYTQNFRDNSYS